jgi:hypothetical protein
MKKAINLLCTALLLLTLTVVTTAQNPPHPNGGNAPGSGNVPVGGGTPLDGGMGTLLLMGVAYAIRKRLAKRK